MSSPFCRRGTIIKQLNIAVFERAMSDLQTYRYVFLYVYALLLGKVFLGHKNLGGLLTQGIHVTE